MTLPEDSNIEESFEPELKELNESQQVSLCEVLDRLLNKGVVIAGEITISVADVDLLYLGLQLVLTSVEGARKCIGNGHNGSLLAVDVRKAKGNGIAPTNTR